MPTGQPSGDRIIWDDANEKHLLLCILADANPSKLDWSRISTSFGKNLSPGAASQKYGKIKARDKQLFEPGSNGTAAATPSGSKKAARKANTNATPSSGAKRTAKDIGDGVEDDEDDDKEVAKTPSKKFKIKEEIADDISSGMDNEV